MASGDTMFVSVTGDSEPPASGYAQIDTRNAILVLAFDAATQEAAVFRGALPSTYGGGGVNVNLYWMGATATTGDVKWDAAWERGNENNNDFDSDNFGTATAGTTTTNATSGKTAKTTLAISHANMGSPAAGDPFRLRVRRVAADAADTMAGDAQLKELTVTEQ